MKKIIALLCFLLAAAMVMFYFFLPSIKQKSNLAKITNFDQCLAAGYPIMESSPRQCTVPGGRFF